MMLGLGGGAWRWGGQRLQLQLHRLEQRRAWTWALLSLTCQCLRRPHASAVRSMPVGETRQLEALAHPFALVNPRRACCVACSALSCPPCPMLQCARASACYIRIMPYEICKLLSFKTVDFDLPANAQPPSVSAAHAAASACHAHAVRTQHTAHQPPQSHALPLRDAGGTHTR